MNRLVNSYVTMVSVMREQRRAAVPAPVKVEPPAAAPAVAARHKKGRLSPETRLMLLALRAERQAARAAAKAAKPESKAAVREAKRARVGERVMLALADGLRVTDVAAMLDLSRVAIYQHIYRVRKRYGESSARGAVLRFVSERNALRQAAADLEYLSWGRA